MSTFTYTVSYWPAEEEAAKQPALDFASIKTHADTPHYLGVRVEEPPLGFLTTLKEANSPAHAALKDVLPPSAKTGLKTITINFADDPTETYAGKLVELAFLAPAQGYDRQALIEWNKVAVVQLKAAGQDICNTCTWGEIVEEPDTAVILIGWESFPVHRKWTGEGGPGRELLMDLFAKIDRGRLFAAHVPYTRY